MRYIFRFWFAFALSLALMAGCSDENGQGGSGGTAGTGGMAGTGGTAGMGGTEPPAYEFWTGTGDGPDGTFNICFVVNDAVPSSLVRPLVSSPGSTCSTDPTYSFAVEFDTCEGALLTTEEIPIFDGTFSLVNEQGGLAGYWRILGTIDGSSAFGSAEVGDISGGTCVGNWEATLSQ